MSMRAGIFRTDHQQLLSQADVPIIGGTRQGLLAVDKVAAALIGPPLQRRAVPASMRLADLLAKTPRTTIHEVDAKRVLAEAGVAVIKEQLVESVSAARAAAGAIGYPVALKVVANELAHKSNFGLLELGIADDDALSAAWAKLDARVATIDPAPDVAGMVVQRMVAGGVEVIVGVKRDPDFGLSMVVGPGVVLVEVIDAVALRTRPLRKGEAEAMIAETPLARLLAGARGQPADHDALVDLIYAVSDFADAEQSAIEEIDLNLVKVLAPGAGCFGSKR
jgi:acyl-CoA synthetase (NDP forming)